jgi:hypothetical protein
MAIYNESDSVVQVYQSSAWVSIGAASAPALDDVTDVTITTPADNELLAYDSGSGEWINQTAAEAGLAAADHDHDGDYDALGAAAAAQSAAQTYADSAVSTHESDTTNVHGRSDTSALLDHSEIDSTVQGYSAKTAAIAALTWAANNIILLTGTGTAAVQALAAHVVTFLGSADAAAARSAIGIVEQIVIAVSDETTDLETGAAKVTFRMPFAMTLTEVRASVNNAPTGSAIQIDINDSGTTIFSTELTIDATTETSESAGTPAVISDSALADDAEITIDIVAVGSTNAGKGLKVTLIGTRV